jgi:hypothetical protein
MSAYGQVQLSGPKIHLTYFPINLTNHFATETTKHKGEIFLYEASVEDSEIEQYQNALNHVIREGKTYPQEYELNLEQFKAYFFSHHAFVARNAEGVLCGMFYVKPNFPGRSLQT